MRSLAVAGLIALAVALSGCAGSGTTVPGFEGAGPQPSAPVEPAPLTSAPPTAAAPSEPSAAASATPTASAVAGTTDCGGQPVTLNASSPAYVLTGDCPSVLVEGEGLTVNGPAVAALEVRGVGNTVSLSSIGPVVVNGQQNLIQAEAIDTFAINGDSNRLNSTTTVTGGTFTGNGNEVHAPGGIGAVTDNGTGNTAGP